MPVTPSQERLRAEVDAHIATFLDQRSRAVPEAGHLLDEIRRVVDAGGKRLRPAFCYWGFRAAGGGHGREIVGLAAAFELLHTFAIVHDDIMDSAGSRRGQPATVALHGLSTALLVGDLALVLADAAFWGSGFPPEVLCDAFARFTTMREEVIAGQHLDVSAPADIDVSSARRIATLKSGSYSIEHPLLVGAQLAGAPATVLEELRCFGRPLGEAFQLRDDILGLFGDPAVTGKPADSDIREGKRHLPYALTLSALDGTERAGFESMWGLGSELSGDDVEVLRGLVESSGARSGTEALVSELLEQASAALARTSVEPEARSALEELMHAAVTRTT